LSTTRFVVNAAAITGFLCMAALAVLVVIAATAT
jgi:hypothetical protein